MYKRNSIKSLLEWWRCIDHQTLIAIIFLMAIGLVLLAAAGPASSTRVGISKMHFVNKQIIFMLFCLPTILFFSMIPKKLLQLLCLLGLIATIGMLVLVPFLGEAVKGAKRWINLPGFSLQPSEFLKPFYSFLIGYVIGSKEWENNRDQIRTFATCVLLHLVVVLLLLLQPDFGMLMTISVVTGVQIFAAGFAWYILATSIVAIVICGAGAYILLPHVARRIHLFLNNDGEVAYQVQKSILSYKAGGMFGRGPGEGVIKYQLPDSHSDFIFAVGGEEFGAIFCLITIGLILFIVARGFLHALKTNNKQAVLVMLAMISYMAFQSIFNIGVTLNMLPTKGMTLPLISYGGSGLISLSIAMGIYLNYSRLSYKSLIREKKYEVHIKF